MKSSLALVLAGSLLAAAKPIDKRDIFTTYVTDISTVTVWVDATTHIEYQQTKTRAHHGHTSKKSSSSSSSTSTSVVPVVPETTSTLSPVAPSPVAPTTSSSSTTIVVVPTPTPSPATTSTAAEEATAPVIVVVQTTITPEATTSATPATTEAKVITLSTSTTKAKTTTSSSSSSSSSSSAKKTTSSTVAAAQPTDYQSTALYHHNIHRANHSAQAVTWDSEIAGYAAITAATCVFAHDLTTGGGGYGQNIAASGSSDAKSTDDTSQYMADAATTMWYNGEVWQFPADAYGEATPDMTNFEKWGHFTQLVWADTTKIGCATQFCEAGTMFEMNAWYTVCNYKSAGNVGGAYGDNVLPSLGEATVTV